MTPLSAAAALDRAIQLADEAARNPVVAVGQADKISALLRRVKEGWHAGPKAPGALPSAPPDARIGLVLERLERLLTDSGRPLSALGATHIVRLEDAPVLTPGSPESGPHKLEWPGGEGIVRSIFGGTLDGEAQNLSRVSVRIAINGSDELFTTGTSAAWVPLVAFQPQNHNWFRLNDTSVTSLQRWTVSFRYEGTGVGPPQISPFLLFGFARRQ